MEVPRVTLLKSEEVLNITFILILHLNIINISNKIFNSIRWRPKLPFKKNFSGFVLKSRSDEAPVRRRSLVERTGMKNLMQVNISVMVMVVMMMVYKTFVANASMIMET